MEQDPMGVEQPDQGSIGGHKRSADEVSAERTEGVSHSDIDAVLDDPTMSAEEKMSRLEELRERVTHRDDEAYAPLSSRLADAFSMLAQGGHHYSDATGDPDDSKR